MKKKAVIKGCVIALSLILISLSAMYLALARYYSGGFSYGTWINGIYCTGKSVNEANQELLTQCGYEGLAITMGDGRFYTILPEEVGCSITFTEPLEEFLQRQNPYLWIDNLIGGSGHKALSPSVSYDEKLFDEKLRSFGIISETPQSKERVEIARGEDGYYLINERQDIFNEAQARELIQDAFKALEPELDLRESGCYYNLPLTKEMESTLKLWEKISDWQSCGIVYQIGEEQIPVDAEAAGSFIKLGDEGDFLLDENGNLCVDEEMVCAFVDELAEKYDTVGIARQFQSTRGDLITVEGGIYGNEIDREAEKEYLLEALVERKKEIHTPAYSKTAREQGSDDIGDTYIEVDMTQQMLYYYVDGKLEIETPVVTGNTSLRRGTPSGTNYVYAKQRNRILRGADYASFVKYWIPVCGNIGIHDASWRSNYGGEIYKRNGSHGCINTPLSEVSKLYDMVEVGTPCIMFY